MSEMNVQRVVVVATGVMAAASVAAAVVEAHWDPGPVLLAPAGDHAAGGPHLVGPPDDRDDHGLTRLTAASPSGGGG